MTTCRTVSCEEYDRSCVEPATEEERSCFMPERCRSDDHWITDNEEDEDYWSPVPVSGTYGVGNSSEYAFAFKCTHQTHSCIRCTSIAPKLTTFSSSTISSLSEESESECDTPLSCFAPSLQALAEINAQERSSKQVEKGLAMSPSHSRAASPMPTLSPCNSSAASSLAGTPSDLQEAGGHYFPSFAIDDDDSVEAYLKARDNAAYDDAMSELVAHQADRAGSRKLGGCNLGVYTKAQLMTDFDCLGGF